jgi:parallel beta-helix repeat protein/predicted outer membrane repeat protein
MKFQRILLAAAILALQNLHSSAATLYVDVNSTNPTPPYADWSTAATNIQDAVDVATNGDLILVTNGVYQTGGRVVYGSLTNRVVINKVVTVQSINGPAVTVIQGYQVPGSINVNGDSAVRCVYLTNNAALIGFTLTNGATRYQGSGNSIQEQSGGGAWCESVNTLISNCVVIGNSCSWYGAGIYAGTLNSCQVDDNTNQNGSLGGGGAAYSTLFNSTISGNVGNNSGAFFCTLSSCILTGNSEGGASSCILNNCIISNNMSSGNGGGANQSTLTNCILYDNQATNSGGGAYDCVLNNCTISNNWAGAFGGGVYCDTFETNSPGQDNILTENVAHFGGGFYLAASASGITNWNLDNWIFTSNSATHDGGGLYLTSAHSIPNNCSFSGNSSGGNGGGLCGPSMPAIVSNCTFSGNIATGNGGGAYSVALNNCPVIGNQASSGGGVYGSINNCVISDNIATNNGGGVFVFQLGMQGACNNSVVTNNVAGNGGGVYSTSRIVSSNCIFSANSAITNGGGVYGAILKNCLLSENSALYGGGGYGATLYNCTVVGNSASNTGGGLYQMGTMANTIVYYNTAPSGSNYYYFPPLPVTNCCTTPLPSGTGNITNAPIFINQTAGNYRLQTNSPCINVGNNSYVVTGDVDLDGRPRIVGGMVDIGAYEFQGPGMGEFIGWLQQYGLPTDGTADYADTDGDGMNNWQEWIAGTDPTNALSVLEMLSPTATNNPPGLVVTWQSVNTRTYYLQSSVNLGAQPAFSTIQSNIVGQVGTTSFTDASATNGGPYFYRVGVQ